MDYPKFETKSNLQIFRRQDNNCGFRSTVGCRYVVLPRGDQQGLMPASGNRSQQRPHPQISSDLAAVYRYKFREWLLETNPQVMPTCPFFLRYVLRILHDLIAAPVFQLASNSHSNQEDHSEYEFEGQEMSTGVKCPRPANEIEKS